MSDKYSMCGQDFDKFMKDLPDGAGKRKKLTKLLTIREKRMFLNRLCLVNMLILLTGKNMREWRNWQTHWT